MREEGGETRRNGERETRGNGDPEIRREEPGDRAAVRHVHEQAFGRSAEADLVDRLRDRHQVTLSLVAEQDGQILGHILFSPVTIGSDAASQGAIGLAPISVRPDYQRQGIGSSLIKTGLHECQKAGYACVVVLGHPEYYPRFGFAIASRYGITCEYDVPDEAFMIAELQAGALANYAGTARYAPEFNQV